ncbi:spermatogenesis-associated protein 48 [Gadus macrocephalus]|uniref:spermatogenesis-associated protein 48 n=1 Tax=Gadus macrocephalus TaxID=80720 RepID=UPI0028CB9C57|nr:spermatogenesis-associated protein 48 [Gadus macrocephalus]
MMAEPRSIDQRHGRVSRKGGRHTFRCLDNSGGVGGSDAFLRHNPQARLPAEHAPVAPSRDDVALFDPCSGQLSAGAEVDLGIKGRQKFIDFNHVPSALRVPSGRGERPQTPRQSSTLTPDPAADKAWNSRRIPDAALRARLGGWTSAVKMRAVPSERTPHTARVLLEEDIGMQDGLSNDERAWMEKAVRRHVYTSSTQRSYQEVDWDAKLPRRFLAPPTTLEKMADPVTGCSAPARYHSRPQLWQLMGEHWDRQQVRGRNDVRKPISFCSPCPKSGQIPLYSGIIGSANKDHIDNMEAYFHPTPLRKTIPPYTPTARRRTIPGYAGKGVYADNTDVSLPILSLPGTIMGFGPPTFGRKGPLSKMVSTTSPWNPFLVPRALPRLPM